jgi:hypothetical protein
MLSYNDYFKTEINEDTVLDNLNKTKVVLNSVKNSIGSAMRVYGSLGDKGNVANQKVQELIKAIDDMIENIPD